MRGCRHPFNWQHPRFSIPGRIEPFHFVMLRTESDNIVRVMILVIKG